MPSVEKRRKYRASWSFNKKLNQISERNFSREGTSSFKTGFILDPEIITGKFQQYAESAAELTQKVEGKIQYFDPESKESLTELANEMEDEFNIKNALNGNCEKRDEIVTEVLEAILNKDNNVKEVKNREELSEITEDYAVLGADLVFTKNSKAANLKFDSSKIRSYQSEKTNPNWDKPFQFNLYGDEEFRKKLTRNTPDLAGKWNDWDLARNKTQEKMQQLGLY